MTALGKILAFVNLIIAMAILSWSINVYAQRPAWFEPKSDAVISTTDSPQSFALLKEEIDNLGRKATAASADWGVQKKRLESLEKLRADRQRGYDQRLQWARDGRDPKNPASAGFFEPVYDPRTGLLDLNTVGAAILGPDNQPLRGVNKLGSTILADAKAFQEQAMISTKFRDDFASIGKDIGDTELRLLKMGVIREAAQAELFHLATFEVNVYETRETVFRRKRQLTARLGELGAN